MMNIINKFTENLRLREFIQVIQFIRPRLRSYFTGLIIYTCTEITFYISMPLAVKYMIDAALKKDIRLLWHGVYFILASIGFQRSTASRQFRASINHCLSFHW